MADISYLMQLAKERQDGPMKALDRFGSTMGGIFQKQDAANDEQDAVRFFTQNDVTPENLRKFQEYHPRMPMQDIHMYAGAIEKQKSAKRVIDNWKTIQSAIAAARDRGEEFNFEDMPKIIKDLRPEDVELMAKYKQAFPNAKIIEHDPTKTLYKQVGGKLVKEVEGVPQEKLDARIRLKGGGPTIHTTKTRANEALQSGKYEEALPEKSQEINAPPDIDTFLAGNYPDYFTDKDVRKEALRAFSLDPDLKEAYKKFREENRSLYQFTSTPAGTAVGNARTGELEQPQPGVQKFVKIYDKKANMVSEVSPEEAKIAMKYNADIVLGTPGPQQKQSLRERFGTTGAPTAPQPPPAQPGVPAAQGALGAPSAPGVPGTSSNPGTIANPTIPGGPAPSPAVVYDGVTYTSPQQIHKAVNSNPRTLDPAVAVKLLREHFNMR